jgi:hypothetical protein
MERLNWMKSYEISSIEGQVVMIDESLVLTIWRMCEKFTILASQRDEKNIIINSIWERETFVVSIEKLMRHENLISMQFFKFYATTLHRRRRDDDIYWF